MGVKEQYWQCGRFSLSLSRPLIMGIVNMTPDSFSDGGVYGKSASEALSHAEYLLNSGADMLDVGGESTRPGAHPVRPEEEWARIQVLLKELINWGVPISVDTRRTWVMQRLLSEGYADVINDVAALTDEGAINLLATYPDIGVCLMHMKGQPETMQNQAQYRNAVADVSDFLSERVKACISAGIRQERLVLDPGIGFAKTFEQNIDLLKEMPIWKAHLGLPLLLGVSRKRFLGEITQEAVASERLGASVMAALECVRLGADIVRVHDVKETRQALAVYEAFRA